MSHKKLCPSFLIILVFFACSLKVFGVSPETTKQIIDLRISSENATFVQWQPLKQSYFDVFAVFNDGTEERVENYNVFGYDSSKTGSQILKFNYEGVTKTHTIMVYSCDNKIAVGEKINIQLRTNNVANVIWHSNSNILSIENISKSYVFSNNYSGYIQCVTISGVVEGSCNLICTNASTNFPISISTISVYKHIDDFSIDKSEIYLKDCDSYKLSVNCSLNNDEVKISWYSDDNSVATVDNLGNIKAVGLGTTKIYAELWDGINKKECVVHVVEPTNSIVANKNKLDFSYRNIPQKIEAYALPKTATYKDILYRSQDERVVSVNENGEVYAHSNGKTNIIISSVDGFSEITIPVCVSGLVMDIDVNQKTIDFTDIGQTCTLTVKILPTDALNKAVIWTSENKKVATVDSNGVVKAISVGETDIIVTTKDGSFGRKIHIIVHPYTTIEYIWPCEYSNGCTSLETILKKDVKWGQSITIQPIKKEGYNYVGTYKDHAGTTCLKKYEEGTKIVAKNEAYTFYVSYTPIRPSKLLFKMYPLSPFYNEKNTALLDCIIYPKKVAQTKINLTCSNSSIACFYNNKSTDVIDLDDYADSTLQIWLKLKKSGTITVIARVSGTSVKSSIELKISKTKGGDYVIENNYNPTFKVTPTSPSEVKFSISNYKNLDRYIIYRTDEKGKIKELCHITSKELSSNNSLDLYDFNLKYGSTYTYFARGYFNNGTCSKQLVAAIKMDYRPTFKAESTGYRSVRLTTNPPLPHKETGSVEVFRSTDKTNWEYLGYKSNKYTFDDTGLENGKVYYYKIRIYYNGIYTKCSTIKSCIPTVSTPKVQSVRNISSGVKIQWNVVKGASSYNIYRLSKSGKWKNIGSTTKTYFVDKSVKSGAEYTYALKSKNNKGTSANISKVTITYLSPPSISKLKSSEKKVSVSWNKTNGATGYVVYMATSKNGKYSKIATLKGNSKVSYTKTGLTKGKTYYFKVAAYTVANEKTLYSSFSSVKAVKIK